MSQQAFSSNATGSKAMSAVKVIEGWIVGWLVNNELEVMYEEAVIT